MKLKKIVLYALLKVLSVFVSMMKIDKNKITFVTLTSNELSGDFKLIAEQLEKEQKYNIKYVLTKFEKNLKGDFLYLLNCLYQLFVINTSALVIINDNNYVISNFKRKGVKVLQIWHACGAVKKFGNDVERQYPIANYDYILSTSAKWKKPYASAFHVKEEQVIPLGMPRTDVLFDEDMMRQYREKMTERFPVLKGKYVVLYAPTFRGNIIKGMRYEQLDLNYVIDSLPDDYVIMSRMHPLLGDVMLGEHERILNVNNENLNELLAVTDCFVSDYSSIIFDFSILERKMIYYAPDLQEYKDTIGLNVEYEKLPGKVCGSVEELIRELKSQEYDKNMVRELKDECFLYQDGKSVERITKFINETIV